MVHWFILALVESLFTALTIDVVFDLFGAGATTHTSFLPGLAIVGAMNTLFYWTAAQDKRENDKFVLDSVIMAVLFLVAYVFSAVVM